MSTNARRDLDETAPNSPVHAANAAGPGGGRQLPVPAAYTFLNVTLDMRRQLLIRGKDEIRLRPRAFDVLRYLVTNAGRLISKQELMVAVWADVAVTDDSLVQCLIEIRRGLGGAENRIKTVRGRGYLLDCEVVPSPAVESNVLQEAPRSVDVADNHIEPRFESTSRRSPLDWMRPRLLLTVLGMSALVAAFIGGRAWLRSSASTGSPGNLVRITISVPAGSAFGAGPWSASVAVNVETIGIGLSPDGSQLAFVATDPSGRRNIWLRPLQTLDARLLPATEGASSTMTSSSFQACLGSSGCPLLEARN
jgi:DNA-binding winged helix-turn-helix (wHTH) protein